MPVPIGETHSPQPYYSCRGLLFLPGLPPSACRLPNSTIQPLTGSRSCGWGGLGFL